MRHLLLPVSSSRQLHQASPSRRRTQRLTDGLLKLKARPPLDECWALDNHYNHLEQGQRSAAGTLVFRAKNYGPDFSSDLAAARQLGRSMGVWLNTMTHPVKGIRGKALSRFDAIVPVPSPRHRSAWTDDLTELPAILSEEIAIEMQAAFILHALEAKPGLPQMKNQPREQRPPLLKDAFTAHVDLTGIRILLVDDVAESQATLSAAADTLKAAGATEVTGYVATSTSR